MNLITKLHQRATSPSIALLAALCLLLPACNGGADAQGVGSQCSAQDDCAEDQQCLTAFKGGYCGKEDCAADADCPDGSICVTHDDGKNYCFLTCVEKIDCNGNRDPEEESNCSASFEPVEGGNKKYKACIPPSSGL